MLADPHAIESAALPPMTARTGAMSLPQFQHKVSIVF